MNQPFPTFPPLLNGHEATAGTSPMQHACAGVASGEFGAGDIVWSVGENALRFALVLEPEVLRERCGEMLYTAMVAFGDAAGALIPPEVAITYQWPNVIQMNDGQIGRVDLALSDGDEKGVPLWMVLALQVQMTPDFSELDPGVNYHVTTLWDEGCGDISGIELLESVSRHTVNAIHTWSEDGFRPLHEQWQGRLNEENPLSQPLQSRGRRFVGIDEIGNGLLSQAGVTTSVAVMDALNEICTSSEEPK